MEKRREDNMGRGKEGTGEKRSGERRKGGGVRKTSDLVTSCDLLTREEHAEESTDMGQSCTRWGHGGHSIVFILHPCARKNLTLGPQGRGTPRIPYWTQETIECVIGT